MDEDLKESWVWGVDLYTRKNIWLSLPENYSDDERLHFIHKVLSKSVNF